MKTVVCAIILLPLSAMAQYKCVVDGHTSYTEKPCSPQAKVLALPADTPVTEDDRRQAAETLKRQKKVVRIIDAQNAIDEAELKRHAAALGEEYRQKRAHCANLLATAKTAERDSNLYFSSAYVNDARQRKKEAEDRHFFECYNRHF